MSALYAARRGEHGPEAQAQARDALAIYRGALRELGSNGAARGPSVQAHVLAFAEMRAASQRLSVLASAAGETPRALALLGQAQRAQGRAERSWTAAVLAAGLLRGRAPDAQPQPAWLRPASGADDDGPDDGVTGAADTTVGTAADPTGGAP